MSLADYQTPKSDSLQPWSDFIDIEEFRQLEREAAAWKAVAEKLTTEMRDLAWLSGPAGSTQPNDAELALAAFDALKSQLEKR